MNVQDVIKDQVTKNPVVLYMKGSPDFPQCGFSANVVGILRACGMENFYSVNVLEDPDIRQGIKQYRKLAHDPTALRRRRVRRWLGHSARDVRKRRTAKDTGRQNGSLIKR